ncbi:MAG: sugar kinase [Pseudomonadales bacterium]
MTNGLMCIGECMMELSGDLHSPTIQRSFAGDTYNAAVYAKRWAPELSVSFLTAIGTDAVSDLMLSTWRAHGLDCSQVLRSEDAIPGTYMIHTDGGGERSFIYWRKNSAATQLLSLLGQGGGIDCIADVRYVFFSGISLAILSEIDRQSLLDLLAILRRRGARIAFDPNYRPALWEGLEQAQHWMVNAYKVSDIVLPGLEDHTELFGHQQREEVDAMLQYCGVEERVIKCDEAGVYASCDGETAHQAFIPAPQQVDSTAAGDSFAGTYLAQRLAGATLQQSISAASQIAGCVVQHRGAIIDKQAYDACRDGPAIISA